MPADERYDVVSPLAMGSEFYGCYNKPRPYHGMPILTPKGEDSGLKFIMAENCQYLDSQKDKRCQGCQHKLQKV